MPGENAFSTTLRSAISASGLGLDRIQARLRSRGVPVSVTSLSYWQSGKRRPERPSSLASVRVLEEILDLPSGTLIGLLPPPRPRGPAARRDNSRPLNFAEDVLRPLLARVGAPNALEQQHQLKLIGVHDRCDIAADGGQRAVTARAVFEANADRQDRWLLAYDHGGGAPRLEGLRNCRTGRVEADTEHGITVAELLFDRPIDRGETHLIEYSLTNAGPPYPECENTCYREFRRPIHDYLLEIRFDTAPKRCWQYARKNQDDPGEHRELKVDNADGVHAVAVDFGPGVYGIAWE